MTLPTVSRMRRAIDNGDDAEIRNVLAEYPEQKEYVGGAGGSWLHYAAEKGIIAAINVLIDCGIDVNTDSREFVDCYPPLEGAVCRGQVEATRCLIERGADVNLGRTLLAAINVSTDLQQDPASRAPKAFELVKLLVESGADVKRCWYMGIDSKKGAMVSALSLAGFNGCGDIADYLCTKGATMPPLGPQVPPKGVETQISAVDRAGYRQRNFVTEPPVPRMAQAIDRGDVDEIRRVLAEYPEQLTYLGGGGGSWLHRAASDGKIEVIDSLIDAGIDVNIDSQGATEPIPPLSKAIGSGQLDVARHLISRGADVNIGRLLIGAINVGNDRYLFSPEREVTAFDLVKLLVESGVDVNRWWYFGDPKKGTIQNALSWALANGREDIADYLREHGALMPPKVDRPASFWARMWRTIFGDRQSLEKGVEQEVVSYFEENFGPVSPLSLGEIVPSESPIRINVVPASKSRNHITLFTTGMSRQRMKALSKEHKDYEHAELFIQLPADWPYKDIINPDHAWPVHWLRVMAAYPKEHGWLPPITIMANEPDEPIAANTKFTSMLVLAELTMTSKAGYPVQFYRLTPLYPEERQMEVEQGIDALIRAFDKYDVPFIVDLHRRNVANP